MLELNDSLDTSSDEKLVVNKNELSKAIFSHSSLVFTSNECREKINEAFRFEGWEIPNPIEKNKKIDKGKLTDLVIVDLMGSDDVISNLTVLVNKLSNDVKLLIINDVDSFRIAKKVEELGCEYLLWPSSKHEIIATIKKMYLLPENIPNQIAYNRRVAKAISVIGTSGGVGASALCVDLSKKLASTGAKCTYVDYKFDRSNLDILFGDKELEKLSIASIGVNLDQLDQESVQEYTYTVNDNINYLGVEGVGSQDELKICSDSLSSVLTYCNNYMIYDWSFSIGVHFDVDEILRTSDTIIILLEPTVFSIRNAQHVISRLQQLLITRQRSVKILAILNKSRPHNYYQFNQDDVEKYLKYKLTSEFIFDVEFQRRIMDKNELLFSSRKNIREFNSLVNEITGEKDGEKNSLISKVRTIVGL